MAVTTNAKDQGYHEPQLENSKRSANRESCGNMAGGRPFQRHSRPGNCWEMQPTLRERQALPLIFAHHQRTPTNRNRQSWKNSGGLPSKACPMNCNSHPKTNSANATHHSR
jgi:hypothetical protein